MKPVRIGIGGPVGSGKTSLVDQLTRAMHKEYNWRLLQMIFTHVKMLSF